MTSNRGTLARSLRLTIVLPLALSCADGVVRGDAALGVARDADGVQRVVRLRIAP